MGKRQKLTIAHIFNMEQPSLRFGLIKFGNEKSSGFGLEKIDMRKKSGCRYRSDSGSPHHTLIRIIELHFRSSFQGYCTSLLLSHIAMVK